MAQHPLSAGLQTQARGAGWMLTERWEKRRAALPRAGKAEASAALGIGVPGTRRRAGAELHHQGWPHDHLPLWGQRQDALCDCWLPAGASLVPSEAGRSSASRHQVEDMVARPSVREASGALPAAARGCVSASEPSSGHCSSQPCVPVALPAAAAPTAAAPYQLLPALRLWTPLESAPRVSPLC